jgi:hypothetical protein
MNIEHDLEKVKRLTRLRDNYLKNEESNYHVGNIVLLSIEMGTREEILIARLYETLVKELGCAPNNSDLRNTMYRLKQRLYDHFVIACNSFGINHRENPDGRKKKET